MGTGAPARRVWEYELGADRLTHGVIVSLVADRIVCWIRNHGLLAVGLDGREAWHDAADTATAQFKAWRDRILTGGPAARSVDAASGATMARRDLGVPLHLMPTAADHAIYWKKPSPDGEGALLGLDPLDLGPRWSLPDPNGRVRVLGGRLYEYDKAAGVATVRGVPDLSVRSTFRVPPELWYFQPLAAEDALIFRTSDHDVEAIDALEGRPLWSWSGGAMAGFDLVADGTLYLLRDRLHALDARTGVERWRVDAAVREVALAGETVWMCTTDGRLQRADGRGQVTAPPARLPVEATVLKMWAVAQDELVVLALLQPQDAEPREVLWRLAMVR